jgi:hypothetical protein
LNRISFLFFFLFIAKFSFGQNVTIATNGQTGISGTNWSISNGILSVTGNAIINPSVISTQLNNGSSLTIVAAGDIIVNNDILKTSGNDATLTLKSNAKVNLNNSFISSSSNKLNLIVWVEADGGGSYGGAIGSINTNGGHLWIGGGSGTTVWNGLTVGNGLSMSDGTSNWNGVDLFGNISTLNGDVYIAADKGNSENNPSIGALHDLTINSGTGDISFIVRDPSSFSYQSKVIVLNSTGVLTIAPPSNENWENDFIWDGTGTTNLTGTNSLNGLIINNQSNLSGLNIGTYLGTGISGDTAYIESNQKQIDINEPLSINGNLNLVGGHIDLNQAISAVGYIKAIANGRVGINASIETTGSNQDIYLKATNEINQAGAYTTETNGGNIVYWANSDGDTGNYNFIRPGSLVSNGGHVWLGGSLFNTATSTWNGLSVGSGYAYSSDWDAIALRANIDTRSSSNSSIGGDVWIAGESGTATSGDIASEGGVRSIFAGNGDIALITHSFVHQNTSNNQTDLNTTGQISIAPASGMDWHDSSFTFNYVLNGSWFEGSNNVDGVHINSFSNIGGLNLGTYNGTGVDGDTPYVASNANNMTISNGITINGPIRVTGDDIHAPNNVDFNTSSTSNADIIFKGQGYVVMDTNVDFTTDGGDVILWGNTVNTATGVANNEVDLRGTNNVSTSGGKIVLAGGLDSNSDGIPDGYAYRSYDDTIRSADLGANVSLQSGGGDILIQGSGGGVGVGFSGSGTSIDSAGGKIEINGIGATNHGVWISSNLSVNSNNGDLKISGQANNGQGIDFEGDGIKLLSGLGKINIEGTSVSSYGIYGVNNLVISSNSTDETAISLTATSTSSFAMYFGTSASKNLLIQSSSNTPSTGNIVLQGNTSSGQIAIGFDYYGSGSKTQILTAAGDISILANGDESRTFYTSTALFLGQRANDTQVNGVSPINTNSTGDIKILSEGGIYANSGAGGLWTIKTGDATNSGGDVIIASDSNNANGGFQYYSSGLTVNSFGGDITLGGGDVSGSGYAQGTTYSTSFSGNGIQIDGALSLNCSGNNTDTGGNIEIRAKGYASTWGAYNINGFLKYGGSTNLNSGTGKIAISGVAPTTQTNATSVGFLINGGTNHYFTSASPSNDAITILGDSSDSNSSSAEGIWFGASSGQFEFIATGIGGGVSITSKGGANDVQSTQINDPVYILANGGDILVDNQSTNTYARMQGDAGGLLTLGYTDAANTNYDVVSSSSNIKFTSTGSIYFDGLITADTNGGNFSMASDTGTNDSGTLNLRGGLDVETNGGDITLGGGNDAGSGYAPGENTETFSEGVRIDDKLNLISDNGDIIIQGKTSTGM